MNYYNDNDPKSCAWLRELIRAGQIPDGVVDERSILDVQPADVAGFVQCHFFAGIGGWSLALKLAGWPEDRPIWTASFPCQPFSCAGSGKGQSDERHLWPEALRLIRVLRPPVILGEQVPAAIKHGWLDGVFDGLEDCGYACGALDLPACSVGAPHIRQRIYWVANATSRGLGIDGGASGNAGHADQRGTVGRMALAQSEQPHGGRDARGGRGESSDGSNNGGLANAAGSRCIRPLGDTEGEARDQARVLVSGEHGETGGLVQSDCSGSQPGEQTTAPTRHGSSIESAGGTDQESAAFPSSAWSNYELIPCADGKARRIESGTFPLAHGVPGRVGLLRGYGNAIVPQVAAQFIKAVMEYTKC